MNLNKIVLSHVSTQYTKYQRSNIKFLYLIKSKQRDDIDIEAMEVALLFIISIECKIPQYSRGCLLLVAARGIWFLVSTYK